MRVSLLCVRISLPKPCVHCLCRLFLQHLPLDCEVQNVCLTVSVGVHLNFSSAFLRKSPSVFFNLSLRVFINWLIPEREVTELQTLVLESSAVRLHGTVAELIHFTEAVAEASYAPWVRKVLMGKGLSQSQ